MILLSADSFTTTKNVSKMVHIGVSNKLFCGVALPIHIGQDTLHVLVMKCLA